MLSWWKGQNSKGINTTDKDVRTLALHVLMGSVFGNNHPFRNIMIPSDSNFKMTFKDALILVLGNLLVVPLIHPIIRFLPFAPKKLATIAAATVELRRYMNDMLQKEKQMISQRNPDNANLMSHLIRASQDEPTAKEENIDPGVSGDAVRGLSNSEIVGNVFFIILAGHETTANTLSYAILLLAAHPEVQEWVAEEVRYVLQDQGSSETWDYELFSRFKRCLAIMVSHIIFHGRIPPSYVSPPSDCHMRAAF
jgi:cytochrome P450